MQYFEAYDHLEVKSIFWINRMNQMACLNDLPKEPLQKLETELSNNIYNAKLAIGELATAAYLERFIPLIYSYIVDIDRDKNEACKEYNYFYQILQNFNENALNFYDIYGLMNDKNKRSFEFYFARQLIKEFREERNYHSGIVDEENPVYLPQPHIKLVNNIYEKCNGGH
uniref:Uncharacterized protein n=1 Tax=Meloidogyne hapla TaxID=6305 RepID=A0A1I8BLV9_MELHA